LGDEVMGKGSLDVYLLVQMGCFIFEDVDEDEENSTKDAINVNLIIV